MPHILGIDHVAFAARDLEASCAFYDGLFGARTQLNYAPEGRSLVRQIVLGAPCLASIRRAMASLSSPNIRPSAARISACAGRGVSTALSPCCAAMASPSLMARRHG
jgi:hypothetical protein